MCGTKAKDYLKLLKINLWRLGPFQLPSYVASPERIKELKMFPGFITGEFIVNGT